MAYVSSYSYSCFPIIYYSFAKTLWDQQFRKSTDALPKPEVERKFKIELTFVSYLLFFLGFDSLISLIILSFSQT